MISPDFSSVVMLSLGHIQQAQENKIAQVKKPFDWMTDEQFHNLQVLATHFEWFQVSLKLLSCQPRVTVTSCFVYKVIRDLESIDHLCINTQVKAVVAGPAGRRAPDHFFGRVCFPPCPFFLVLAHFSLCLPLIFNLLMQSSITLVARVIHRPTKV